METGPVSERLVLGPVLRHVDRTSATVWVQTVRAGTVAVVPEGHDVCRARTFTVHGCHYALVEVGDLRPGAEAAYRVLVDDEVVWPEPDSPFPPSVIRTLDDRPLRMAFGSCRTSVPHDAEHHRTHGVDALRSYALALAAGQGPQAEQWPHLMLLLGDQVYADVTSEAMQEFIASRRSLKEGSGEELKDYTEYAHLYSLAWRDPALRWLLSCLPSLMVFDDHDVRDDWNTSARWREEMTATPWWHGRIVAALGSYWVYQHLGNLSNQERAQDEMWQELQRRQDGVGPRESVDLSEVLDRFAARVDEHPDTYRWSYARDLDGSRLVVVDSRAARVLEAGERSVLDETEMAWLDEQLRGDYEHLFIGTSLPYLLPPGLHHLEAWNEALVDGRWGRRFTRPGEKLRTMFDLEHWAAFNQGFRDVAAMVTEVADGGRGRAPRSVTFLSGDVHHSYVLEVDRSRGSRVLQLVCSPIRNPLPRPVRALTAVLAQGLARPVGALMARSAKVPHPPFGWSSVAGPWFDNNLAVLQVEQDEMRVVWLTGEIHQGDHEHPRLEVVADVRLDVPAVGTAHRRARATVHPNSWLRHPRSHLRAIRGRSSVR
jgi:hypothetical protein